MLPVLELRGAIPYGMARGLSFWPSLLAGIIGNMIPVPFIILFVRKVFMWIRRRLPRFGGAVTRWERRAREKAKYIDQYKLLGLTILVAIPLPGTGAWTGALVAAMLDIRMRNAFPAIGLGVVIAGVIVAVLSHGTGMILGI